MLYAKQVSPEWQDNDLFVRHNRELSINDDYYVDNIIIDGNRDFMSLTTKAYEKLKKLTYDLWYDWQNLSSCGFGNKTEFIEYYFNREDGKKYSKKEIHQWCELIENWNDDEDQIVTGLNLITRKKWRSISLRGYCQSDWQEGYASEELSSASVRYIEMCYFNTGMEFIVYESEEDYENEENGYSIYVSDVDDLRDRLGEEVRVFIFTGYSQIANYEEVKDQL